jgi:hypothetical protein
MHRAPTILAAMAMLAVPMWAQYYEFYPYAAGDGTTFR